MSTDLLSLNNPRYLYFAYTMRVPIIIELIRAADIKLYSSI